MVQIGKFLCLSDREFPEFFKTHPTLICRSIFNASRSLQTNRTCYLIALVHILSYQISIISISSQEPWDLEKTITLLACHVSVIMIMGVIIGLVMNTIVLSHISKRGEECINVWIHCISLYVSIFVGPRDERILGTSILSFSDSSERK